MAKHEVYTNEEPGYPPQIYTMKYTGFKFIFALVLCFSYVYGQTPEIVKNVTNGVSFYHMSHTLTAADIRLDYPPEYFNERWPESSSGACEVGSNGHFDIFIRKESIPVPAPYCNSEWLKVTMDGRSNSAADADSKNILWDQMKEVKNGERDSVEIVIELNYVDVVSDVPLTMILTQCNLSFRTAHGSYVDHTQPLK